MGNRWQGVPINVSYTSHFGVNGGVYVCELHFEIEDRVEETIEPNAHNVVSWAESRKRAFSGALSAMNTYVDQKNAEIANQEDFGDV